MEKILLISLKLNFTPNYLGCFGFKQESAFTVNREILVVRFLPYADVY